MTKSYLILSSFFKNYYSSNYRVVVRESNLKFKSIAFSYNSYVSYICIYRKQPRQSIINPDWDFGKMGIGGLDNEFNAIFRRAFASRVFPPEVVEQLGKKHKLFWLWNIMWIVVRCCIKMSLLTMVRLNKIFAANLFAVCSYNYFLPNRYSA